VQRRTRTALKKAEIGLKVGKVLDKYKVGKHFEFSIGDGQFTWRRKQQCIYAEAALDGIYVIRSSEPAEHLSAADAVRHYKMLAEVRRKKAVHQTDEGHPVYSFRTLLAELDTQCRNTCQFGDGQSAIEITKLTEPTPLQSEALRLLQEERVVSRNLSEQQ